MPLTFEYRPPTASALPLVNAAADVGVKEAAEHLLSVSADRAPKESGRMRDSGAVTDFTGLGAGPAGVHMAAVSYGREDGDGEHADTAAYTVRQHEEQDYHHDVGEAGWLAKSMHSEREALLGLMGAAIKTALKL